jgi:hypothetical protein
MLQLAKAVRRARAEEERFVASLSPAERGAAGTHEDWSPTDLVAHIAAAKRRLVRAIDGELETLEHDESAVYAAHEHDSWDDVQRESAGASRALLERIGREVNAPWLEGRSLNTFIAGYAIRHPIGHLADYHEKRGAEAEAKRVRRAGEAILALLGLRTSHGPRKSARPGRRT